MLIQNNGYDKTFGRWMTWIGCYTKLFQKRLIKLDTERWRNAYIEHQEKKMANKYKGKAPLVEPVDVQYEAGKMFEDHTPTIDTEDMPTIDTDNVHYEAGYRFETHTPEEVKEYDDYTEKPGEPNVFIFTDKDMDTDTDE